MVQPPVWATSATATTSRRSSTCRRTRRAVLVLREVPGVSAREVAESRRRPSPLVNSAFTSLDARGRAHDGTQPPAYSRSSLLASARPRSCLANSDQTERGRPISPATPPDAASPGKCGSRPWGRRRARTSSNKGVCRDDRETLPHRAERNPPRALSHPLAMLRYIWARWFVPLETSICAAGRGGGTSYLACATDVRTPDLRPAGASSQATSGGPMASARPTPSGWAAVRASLPEPVSVPRHVVLGAGRAELRDFDGIQRGDKSDCDLTEGAARSGGDQAGRGCSVSGPPGAAGPERDR
jgi:hypothetical protein